MLLIYLLEPNANVESTSNVYIWNKYAVSFSLLQEMLKLRSLYEQIEEKLSLSVRKVLYSYLLHKLTLTFIIF